MQGAKDPEQERALANIPPLHTEDPFLLVSPKPSSLSTNDLVTHIYSADVWQAKQNSNESFLCNMLWSLCPKERWANLRTVETALYIAGQRFNKRSSAHMDVLMELELMVGPTLEDYTEREDTARVVKSTRKT
ncbi:hypothetical protein ACOMHN_004498 [Nucella lapillus]